VPTTAMQLSRARTALCAPAARVAAARLLQPALFSSLLSRRSALHTAAFGRGQVALHTTAAAATGRNRASALQSKPCTATSPWRRWLSSSSSSSDGSQPLAAHFVPFARTLPQAQEAYLSWARRQRFAPDSIKTLSAITDTDEAYLPFFVFDVAVVSRFGGRVGKRSFESQYNPQTRQYEMRPVVHWRRVPLEVTGSAAAYSSDQPQMQVYGAFKFKWQPIQVVKSPLTGRLRTPASMQPNDFRGKEVHVFEMKPDTAHGRILEFVRQQEQARGEELLRQRYGADEVDVDAEVSILNLSVRRVYQPAYIFHLQHLGQNFEVIVNGQTGAIQGQFIYSETKIAAAFAVPTTALWLYAATFAHTVPMGPISFVVCVMLPTVIAGVAGRWWAHAREYLREQKRESDRAADAALREGSWREQQWAQQQRQQTAGQSDHRRTEKQYEQRYEQAYQRQQPREQPAKPKKTHYDVLGIQPGASLEDIRSAFRAKSFQWHPDVNKGHEAQASERFREVLEAYQTLRDPVKRAQYDCSI